MRRFIRQKHIFHLMVTLHVVFLCLPVSHGGEIVLCYKNAGQIGIEVTMPEGCSSCNQTGGNLESPDPCFCVDIPLSKGAIEHSMLPGSGTVRVTPQACLASSAPGQNDPALLAGEAFPPAPPFFTRYIHESLHTTVLLI